MHTMSNVQMNLVTDLGDRKNLQIKGPPKLCLTGSYLIVKSAGKKEDKVIKEGNERMNNNIPWRFGSVR